MAQKFGEYRIGTLLPMSSSNAEPLLHPTTDRLILLPIKYPKLWEKYKQAQTTFWTLEEIDMAEDRGHWTKLSTEERELVGLVLAFFSASDGIVNENLVQRFCTEVQAPEARAFYGFQIMMENVHAETYAALIDNCITDQEEKVRLLRGIETIPVVTAKADWCFRWMNDVVDFGTRLVAFAAVEGIFFSSSFAAIFWLRKKGLMPGLAQANQLICRDEGLHTEFACTLFMHLQNRPSSRIISAIIIEAVELEHRFVKESLKVGVLGMSSASMCAYVEFVADHLLVALGEKKKYNTVNPFDFMELVSLEGKSNFFERKVSEYSRAQMFVDMNDASQHSLFDAEF